MQPYFSLTICRQIGCSLLLVCLIHLTGCDQSTPTEYLELDDLHPVKGKVLFRGQPIPDAAVRIHPVSAGAVGAGHPVYPMTGTVSDDGNFEIFTFRPEGKGKGAPSGDYRLTVSWRGPLQGLTKDQEEGLKEKLPVKYTDPRTSQLTVTVTEGQNEMISWTDCSTP
jgi:hypothetical protein